MLSMSAALNFTEPFVFNSATQSLPPLSSNSPDGGAPKSARLSFRDMLAEGQGKVPVKEKVDLLATGLAHISFEGGNRLLPKLNLEEKYFQELCNPRKEEHVVKLLGKTVG